MFVKKSIIVNLASKFKVLKALVLFKIFFHMTWASSFFMLDLIFKSVSFSFFTRFLFSMLMPTNDFIILTKKYCNEFDTICNFANLFLSEEIFSANIYKKLLGQVMNCQITLTKTY